MKNIYWMYTIVSIAIIGGFYSIAVWNKSTPIVAEAKSKVIVANDCAYWDSLPVWRLNFGINVDI